MRRTILLLTLAALGCCLQSNATAGLVYSNGAPDNGVYNDMSFSRQADDFTLGAGASVTSIRFWWSHNLFGSLADFSGTVTYSIHQDSAGAIGSQIATGTVSGLTYTSIGGNLCPYLGGNCPIQQTDIALTAPVALAAGTYWLELHEGTSMTDFDNAPIYWAASSSFSGNAVYGVGPGCPVCALPSNVQYEEFAFQLFDSQVPEPGTMGLAALGLGAVAWLRRRRG